MAIKVPVRRVTEQHGTKETGYGKAVKRTFNPLCF
jgi:hypothetical protein